MFVESITLRNFRSFGPIPERIALDPQLTAFIGTNGTGKTVVCEALRRLFGVTNDERQIRPDDFHVAPDDDLDVPRRDLSIEAVIAFPELSDGGTATGTVPDFYLHLAATAEGELRLRLRLESSWQADGTIDGAIETEFVAITTMNPDPSPEDRRPVPATERSRIQFVYVPAARDGARHVTAFLRGRLWRAARWSKELRDMVSDTAQKVGTQFHKETATEAVETAFASRWQQLHGSGTHGTPRFQPFSPEIDDLLRDAELTFEPDHTRPSRAAGALSDGQRSLLHLALTTASLDIERDVLARGPASGFDQEAALLPALTILAVEEPENNLSPFYLSRIIAQLLELGTTPRVQTLLSSHSASALRRVDPAKVRHFRLDEPGQNSQVRAVKLPAEASKAGKFVREAVRAHPELYFARFVILGEGDSEEVVLPRIAKAMGVDLDPAFVAMVPLGGRHTKHFWQLLTELGVPHATLLDLDWGRHGGGGGRVRDAVRNLEAVGVPVLADIPNVTTVKSISNDMPVADLNVSLTVLQEHGVFFSRPLDLDMAMMTKFRKAYEGTARRKPGRSSAYRAVLQSGGTAEAVSYWNPADQRTRTRRQTSLRWYRLLFSTRSKPATHLSAMSQLTDDELSDAPAELRSLISFMSARLGAS